MSYDIYFAEIQQNKELNQQCLKSNKNFSKGAVIASFSESVISKEITYLTVQVSKDEHISLQPELLQYINHSCDPNVFFNVDTKELVALKDIESGEEFTFFYPSTEWKMVQPFDCFCGSDTCLGYIEGAVSVPVEVLKNYKLSCFISQEKGFCNCGSMNLFSNCCKPLIEGIVKSNSAEQLMRSRFTAYSISAIDYLIKTTHPSLRKFQDRADVEAWANENKWLELEIINSTETTVEFKAHFLNARNQKEVHHEKSTFVFEDGNWFYLKGEFF